MTLHILNKNDSTLWQTCLQSLQAGDALLLIEDGVYLAMLNSAALQVLNSQAKALSSLHVLAEDLALRGISARIAPVFSCIPYQAFVELCLQHNRVVNWH
jgi:tRNA 2-thiouridine synthesizing protein B